MNTLDLLKKTVTHFLVVGSNLLSLCLERNGDRSRSIKPDLNLSYVSRMSKICNLEVYSVCQCNVIKTWKLSLYSCMLSTYKLIFFTVCMYFFYFLSAIDSEWS